MRGSHSGILSACKDKMQKSQYQIKKGKTEAGSRWKEESQRLLRSVFAVRIPITDNHPICFGRRYYMEFFNSAITVLQTLVVALGAGLGIWGAINLLEGYGNDNPGAKSQGMKQLMAK